MSGVTERILASCGESERLAWQDYLEACRTASFLSYDEVEPWAWRRLQRELARIKRMNDD